MTYIIDLHLAVLMQYPSKLQEVGTYLMNEQGLIVTSYSLGSKSISIVSALLCSTVMVSVNVGREARSFFRVPVEVEHLF